jgi:hypothetical protein
MSHTQYLFNSHAIFTKQDPSHLRTEAKFSRNFTSMDSLHWLSHNLCDLEARSKLPGHLVRVSQIRNSWLLWEADIRYI